jgi:membrane protease YdiL (CAAX protease family)
VDVLFAPQGDRWSPIEHALHLTKSSAPLVRERGLIEAVVVGMVVMLAGTLPRNLLFAANLRAFPSIPWAVPLVAVYLWFFWRYLNGHGPPSSTAQERRASLRATRLAPNVWAYALLAGGLAIVALVLALRLANRLVVLPDQQLPDVSSVPRITLLVLLLAAAPVAGIVEEASFRGYMQGPIERRHGLLVAILVTGTMFAVAHLDFTLALWPYYVAVAAIYGSVTYLTNSILPAVVLHTGGNIFSNLDLWLHGQAEWQAAAGKATLIWESGVDRAFWTSAAVLLAVGATTTLAFFRLAGVTGRNKE